MWCKVHPPGEACKQQRPERGRYVAWTDVCRWQASVLFVLFWNPVSPVTVMAMALRPVQHEHRRASRRLLVMPIFDNSTYI